MNELVTKEIAILLKNKGFDEECNSYYKIGSDKIEELQYYHTDRNYSQYSGFPDAVEYFVPNIGQVIDWLYGKGVWISVDYYDTNLKFCGSMTELMSGILLVEDWKFDTPYDAYINVIKQYLTNDN